MMDKVLTCIGCGEQFTFTAGEEKFYANKGFTEPKRCAGCRAKRKAALEQHADDRSPRSKPARRGAR